MQGLVYLFIGLIGVATGFATYFGLTFTPIEAGLAGTFAFMLSLFAMERALRRRSDAALERRVQDLSRLVSTNAQAGQSLSLRLNALADVEASNRLDTVEADVSVLGTVVRQLAESLTDLEDLRTQIANQSAGMSQPEALTEPAEIEPVIPLEMVRQAIADDRLVFHVQPIVTLPEKRTHGYDLTPRLLLEDGEIAGSDDFMPRKGGDDVIRQIERAGLREAITFARRARTAGKPATFYAPLSPSTTSNNQALEQVLVLLESNKAVCDLVHFRVTDDHWQQMTAGTDNLVESIANHGAGFSIDQAKSFRLNFSVIASQGVRSIRGECARFINNPTSYTDFHTADITDYVQRFEIDIIIDNVTTEQQILTLLDDGIGFAQGPHIAPPGAINAGLQSGDAPNIQSVGQAT